MCSPMTSAPDRMPLASHSRRQRYITADEPTPATLAPAEALDLGLVTATPDDLDWAEEIRIALESGDMSRFASAGSCNASTLAASRAALMAPALPIASVPTGMPAGICTIDNNESTPRNIADSIGTPSTGSALLIVANIPFALIGGIVASTLLGLDAKGVKLLGEVPQGLPALGIPDVYWSDLNALLPLVLACFSRLDLHHPAPAEGARCTQNASAFKILLEFNSVKFDKNSRRIRIFSGSAEW